MSLCNSHDYERFYFQKFTTHNCLTEPYVYINYLISLALALLRINLYNVKENLFVYPYNSIMVVKLWKCQVVKIS